MRFLRVSPFCCVASLKKMEKFIAHQVQLVETEQRIDVEDTLKLLSAYAPIQLQRRGVALVGLKVTGTTPLYKKNTHSTHILINLQQV
jgi:hypothetical protein